MILSPPNHPAPGKAGIAFRLAIGHYWPGLSIQGEDVRSEDSPSAGAVGTRQLRR